MRIDTVITDVRVFPLLDVSKEQLEEAVGKPAVQQRIEAVARLQVAQARPEASRAGETACNRGAADARSQGQMATATRREGSQHR